MCLILFLFSTARIATAHTFIGLAVATSMRMGLHSQTSCEGLSDLEIDLRRGVFWTIVKLDLYSGTILGLPSMVNLDYVDQPKPNGLIRGYEFEDGQRFTSDTTRRIYAASTCNLTFLSIISKLIKKFYPKTDGEACKARESKTLVSNTTISEIEKDFKAWRGGLSDVFGSQDSNNTLIRYIIPRSDGSSRNFNTGAAPYMNWRCYTALDTSCFIGHFYTTLPKRGTTLHQTLVSSAAQCLVSRCLDSPSIVRTGCSDITIYLPLPGSLFTLCFCLSLR